VDVWSLVLEMRAAFLGMLMSNAASVKAVR
jgi:hypothetical protein